MIDTPDLVWFQGVVEDRNDPKKLGRCRVRCLGYHTPDKQVLPTEDLPWAHPLGPIGQSCQQPIIIGTLGGIPQSGPNTNLGFSDPDGVYPGITGEADTNRLARNEKIDETVVQTKKEDLDEMDTAGGAGGGGSIQEPETPYNAQYPLNKVKQSESGHIIEIDDTEGAERIHIYHKSGTFVEIHPDGSMVSKVKGSKHEVVISDNNIHVKGNCNVTVDGDSSILTKGESTIKSESTQNIESDGNIEIKAAGTVNISGGNGSSTISVDTSSIRQNASSILLN
jgi:hypothetical protein